jgi:hypothetical protein
MSTQELMLSHRLPLLVVRVIEGIGLWKAPTRIAVIASKFALIRHLC